MTGGSVARRTLWKIGLRIALVIAAMTGLAYYHIYATTTDAALDTLEKYIAERGHRERENFVLASEQHARIKAELLRRLEEMGEADPRAEFDALFVRFPDGVIRNRLDGFDGTRRAFAYIDKSITPDADLRRRVLAFYHLSNQFGPAWNERFENLYFTTPENILVGYYPDVPDYAHTSGPDLDMRTEEWVWIADKKHNPERKMAWTGVLYDPRADLWMISGETPVDIDGRHVATIGQDFTLNDIMARSIDDRLDGAYNVIFRKDGRLIAHPDIMEDIKTKGGGLDIKEFGDKHLADLFETVLSKPEGEAVIELKEYDHFLAIAPIEEPGWFFVTVYPKALISKVAFEAAGIVLLLGALSLAIEILIFFFVIRKDVSLPLNTLVAATDAMASGDYAARVEPFRDDEIGRLSRSFTAMRDAIMTSHLRLSRTVTKLEAARDELGRSRDDLERRVAERTRDLRNLTQAVEQSPHMVLITDLDARIIYVNRRFTDLTGYAPAEVMGKNPSILQSGDTPVTLYSEMWSALMSDGQWFGEIKDRCKDGRAFWAALTVSRVMDEEGEPTHFVAIHEDITERKLAEQDIRIAKEQAETASRAKSEMLANMSHELRTPLNAIIGYSDSILHGIFGPMENEKYLEYVQDINHSGAHLLELINDVLDVSAIEAGKLELDEEDVDLAKLVESCNRLIAPRAEAGRVSIETDVPDGVPWIHADKRRIKQALLNLLSNAVKFTPENGSVATRVARTPDGGLEIRVEDTGVGMTPQELSKAMEEFGQADSGLDRKFEGTGLGLPLTKGLIELHGGELTIESRKNAGTTAIIALPKERLTLVSSVA